MNKIVETKYGKVEGLVEDGLLRFRGIPFAKQPHGDLKWKRATECEPWEGVLKAHQYGDMAPQFCQEKWMGSLDCLTINVIRKEAGTTEEKLPVFVWIHGGGYSIGSCNDSMYYGDEFAKDGCVYVNFQYRLSVLGFYEFSAYPGCESFETNRGLSDMVMALKWIHENIAAFGGDPDNVTIAGESAGGSAVITLMAVPAVKGYFNKAIVESGLCELVDTVEVQRRKIDLLLEGLGLESDDSDLCQKIKEMDDFKLIEGHIYQEKHAQYVNPGTLGTGPVIDDLLPERPIDALNNGASADVKLIIGTNLHEGTMFVHPEETMFPNSWEMVKTMLEKNGISQLYEEFEKLYKEFEATGYYGDAFVKLATDIGWEVPSTKAALAHSKYNDTYVYRFEYMTDFAKNTGMLVTHAFELPCVFGVHENEFAKIFFEGEIPENSQRIIDEIHTPWVNFTKTGVPNPGVWETYSSKNPRVMIFDHESRMADLNRKKWMDLWSEITLYKV